MIYWLALRWEMVKQVQKRCSKAEHYDQDSDLEKICGRTKAAENLANNFRNAEKCGVQEQSCN